MQKQDGETSSAAPGLQRTLEERITIYKVALQNSKAAGEASKVRRYDRGLKVSPPLSVKESRVTPSERRRTRSFKSI